MSRIPGKPEEKLILLSRIDERSLPYLIGDILHFVMDHQDIKVVDGPGDGKRDIISFSPEGNKHITQCKFHGDTQASVSTRETDELILALHKFGTKSGLIATTGRISPQAKREYLDNYPNFNLSFLDGVAIVDSVLAHPILSSVWFDGQHLTLVKDKLIVPFIVRNLENDTPVTIPPGTHKFSDLSFIFESTSSGRANFAPYREPKETNPEEFGDHIHCYEVTWSQYTPMSNVESAMKTTANAVSTYIKSYINEAVVFRLGIPYLTSSVQPTETKIGLDDFPPTSFVVSQQVEGIPESEWILLNKDHSWVFPKHLSTLQADWAGWFNFELDTICMLYLDQPYKPPYQEQLRLEARENWYKQSLFIAGSQENCDVFLSELDSENQPDWMCQYGFGGKILGWFHPFLIAEKSRRQFLIFSNVDKSFSFSGVSEADITNFKTRINSIKAESNSQSLLELTFEQAKHAAAITGEILNPEIKFREYRSAELVHYFDEIPSPIDLTERKLLFVRMWQINQSPHEIRQTLGEHLYNVDAPMEVYWDAKRGYSSNETFLLSSLIFTCPTTKSTTEYFDELVEKRDYQLAMLQDYILLHWKSAELRTKFFWDTEVGLLF